MSDSPPPLPKTESAGTTAAAGQSVDEGKGRIFPCEGCGADLKFNIGQQRLKCPYCGYEKDLKIAEDDKVVEQDFHGMLARMRELREQQQEAEPSGASEVRCDSCGGTVVFVGTLTSSECPYCASPIQRDKIHDAENRIPVDGVLGFLIEEQVAKENLERWVRSLWFAPNDLKKRRVVGAFNGVYLPFWTYDSLTATRYTGQRGEYYYVTTGTGKNKRRQRRTRWYPASGAFQRFFDDVLVLATKGMNRDMMLALEPWPLDRCQPFNQEMLAGFLARTYDVELDEGFREAKQRIDDALESDVHSRIGGDTQRVHSIQSRYDAITYKHLLLPVWLVAYRYKDKPYQVMINAATGEVQGDRPWSWVKILLLVLSIVAVGSAVAFFASAQ